MVSPLFSKRYAPQDDNEMNLISRNLGYWENIYGENRYLSLPRAIPRAASSHPFGIEEPAISCRSADVGGNETSVDLNHTGFTPGAPATPNETAPPAALPPVQLVAVDGS